MFSDIYRFSVYFFNDRCESKKAKSERLRLMDEAYEVGVAIGLAESCGVNYPLSCGIPK